MNSVSIHEFFVVLNEYKDEPRIPLEILESWLESGSLVYSDVTAYLGFHRKHYQRNLMVQGANYQALVLCWRAGQRSPIHDHQGSNCAVKVLLGNAIETAFEHAPNGMIYPAASRTMPANSTSASHDDDIHQMSNLQADNADLVTLHIYSPPLLVMNTFSLFDDSVSRFHDPINTEFAGGSGI